MVYAWIIGERENERAINKDWSEWTIGECIGKGGFGVVFKMSRDVFGDKEERRLLEIKRGICMAERQYNFGDTVLGRWKLVRVLGQGSYGKVYEAHRNDFGETYKAAIKIISVPYDDSEIFSARAEGMSDESIRQYYRNTASELSKEFMMMAQLNSSANIVRYEDSAIIPHEDGFGWDIIVRMELLEPLLTHISKVALSVQEVVQLGIDICRGLELCHAHKIIHRDVKPENLFVSKLGIYKIGDFGSAKVSEKTMGGMSQKGTYGYMAPEVYRQDIYKSNVDIYSLGIVMYRLLNYNRMPFMPLPPDVITHNDRESAFMRRMKGEQLPSPPKANEQLAEIILKACAYDPNERYATAKEMRIDLEELLGFGVTESKDDRDFLARSTDHTLNKPGNEIISAHSTAINTQKVSGDINKVPERENKGKKLFIPILLLLAGLVMIVVSVIAMITQREKTPYDLPEETSVITESTAAPTEILETETESVTETTAAVILNGWHAIDGVDYYYIDNEVAIGDLQIDDEWYYFNGDGVPHEGWRDDTTGRRYYDNGKLLRGTSTTLDNCTYYFANDGYLAEIESDLATATTSKDQFYFSNGMGGTTHVNYQILNEPIENCKALTYQAAINTTRGSIEGTWVFCLRVNGQWQRIETFEVEGEIAYAFIEFDKPISFDAFTAYYSGGGSFSYNSTQYLANVKTQYIHER